MNTYRVIRLPTGRWAVEWRVDGALQGQTLGTYDSEAEALFAAYDFTRMECREMPRRSDP